MSQVAVLGSGPAGLFAALAVEQSGHTPVIFAEGIKSEMFGAMYLHRAIPGLSDPIVPDFEIDIIKSGSKEGYAYNVYGRKEASCSWDFIGEAPAYAWDLGAHYDLLWDRYQSDIRRYKITPENMGSICNNYPLVFCSIPAPALCSREHHFQAQNIWVIHGRGTHLIEGVNDNNMMYYNGVPWDGSFQSLPNDTKVDDEQGHGATFMRGHEWYRFSQIQGYQAWEYSREPNWTWEDSEDAPGRQKSTGKKPLWNNCGCWSEYGSYHRIGRFGCWQKAVLTHHAYEQALAVCGGRNVVL